MSALERFKREYAIKSDYDLAMLGLVLEEHAHELAEKIREEKTEITDSIPGWFAIDAAADLIDPEVGQWAGP